MPSKPELETAYTYETGCQECRIRFYNDEDFSCFSTWLSEHGWKAFQDFYELQEVKNDASSA